MVTCTVFNKWTRSNIFLIVCCLHWWCCKQSQRVHCFARIRLEFEAIDCFLCRTLMKTSWFIKLIDVCKPNIWRRTAVLVPHIQYSLVSGKRMHPTVIWISLKFYKKRIVSKFIVKKRASLWAISHKTYMCSLPDE